MALILWVSNNRVEPLRTSLRGEFRISVARSWQDLTAQLAAGKPEGVILDLAVCTKSHLKNASILIGRFPHVPFLAYAETTKRDLLAIASLSRHGLQGVLVHEPADAGTAVVSQINAVLQNPVSAAVVEAFASTFEKLPLTVQKAARELFLRPRVLSTSRQFANKASVSLSKLYRDLSSAGFMHPRRLIISAKLFAFIGCFDSEDDSVKSLAGKLGYKSARVFSEHCQKVLHTTPQSARLSLSKEDAIRRVLEWLAPESSVESYMSTISTLLNLGLQIGES